MPLLTSPASYPVKIGLFGIGLDTYWPQFAGLETRLTGYLDTVVQRPGTFGAEIVNLGLVDTPEKALAAGHQFRQADVSLIFLHVTTYALSATVLPVVQRAGVPVAVLNLSPEPAIDYARFNQLGDRTQMTGAWLAHCSPCPVPEIANVFKRAAIPFHQVTGLLNNDPEGWQDIQAWVEARRVAHVMAHNCLGLMGNYYGGMLDIYTDLTTQIATFGGFMKIIEVDELSAEQETVTPDEVWQRVVDFQAEFAVQSDCLPHELDRAARTSVALDRLVARHGLGSLAYYHKGTGNAANESTMSSIVLGTTLLTARYIPVAGEYEVKNAQAMKIMDSFGAGGSFSEYYAMDYTDDVVLMGHDGPGHTGIAEGKTKLRPLGVYHGKVGAGLSVETSVRQGPVTILSVVETGSGKLLLLVAEGESAAGPILEIGNTNSRYRFTPDIRQFVQRWNSYGPAHHCTVGVGHIADKISKLGALLRIEVVRV